MAGPPRTVEANGLAIAYVAEGAGTPLIMLHGATSSGREDWAAQLPAFRRHFRVHLPDARGHAGTAWDVARGWSAEMLVDDLAAFADALALATFHLVGFSMGGGTALRFAIRSPERLRTLVLVGVDVLAEPRTSVSRRLLDPERIERDDPAWAAALERRHAAQGPGAWRRLAAAIGRDIAEASVPTPRDLRRITAPTLVVVGDRDPFVPVSHAEALCRQLPDARLLVVPDCDHRVQVVRPGLFNEACAGFYRSTEGAARARAARVGRSRPTAHPPGERRW
ncbi:MAG: hypothetical protein A2X23_11110 [Chloroflexi bacterium GWC2_73_18]|nr:MAG: hypothetical protein A2X23_11110 [Chloroflexi bacterium GWC2_73_18]